MKIFRNILFSFTIFFVLNCKRKSNENALLLADREAPMGWISLRMYNDKTFEFIYSGLFTDDIYPGTFKVHNDTIYFEYSEKTPKAGKIAIIEYHNVKLDAPEILQIKLNKLKKIKFQ